jgi:hypothetical protein
MPDVVLEEVKVAFVHDPSHAAAVAAWERERAEWLLLARRRDALADRIGRDHPDLPGLPPSLERPTTELHPVARIRARLPDGRVVGAEIPLPATRRDVLRALSDAVAALGEGSPVAEGEVVTV